MVNRERLVNEFLELVKVDSLSGQERQIAELLKQKLIHLGLDVYEDNAGGEVGATAGNLIATLPGNVKNEEVPVLLFSAHMDTVEPGRGIKPIIEEGVIRSSTDTILGADDKAGIAAILEAIRVILENDIEHGELEIVFTIWEEGGLKGAKALDYSRINAKIGYVLDSDGEPGTIIVSAPAHNNIAATIKGKAAHAGQCPENGVNAIVAASKAISKMNIGRIDSETTANIGIIKGGKATNIVPDHTYIEGEARSLDVKKLELQTKHMCETLKTEVEKFNAEVIIKVTREYNAIKLSENSPVVEYAVQAARKIGLTPKLTHTGGGSDASVFNERGISCAVLGIGMNKVHTVDENIKIDDLCNTANIVIEIVKLACSN